MLAVLVGVGSAQSADNIKIGFFSSTTGFAASDGLSALHGAEIAIDFVNESGGVNGKKLELISYDDASKPDQAVNVAQRLVSADGVTAVVSGSYSFLTRPAAAIFQRSKVLLVTAYAVHPQITATGDYIFRTSLSAQVEGASGAWTVSKLLGKKSVALITMDNDAGFALAGAFKKMAGKLGLKILTEEKYALGDSDLRPILNRISAMKPDAIYANGFYAQAAMLANQRQELGLKMPVVGMEGFDSPKFLSLANEGAAEGFYFTTALDRASKNKVTKRFIDESGF